MSPNQPSSKTLREALEACKSYSQSYDLIATSNTSRSKLSPKVVMWKDSSGSLKLSEDDSDSISDSIDSFEDNSCTGIDKNLPVNLESYRFIKSLKESEHRPTTTRLTGRPLDCALNQQFSFSSSASSGPSSRNSFANPSSMASSRSNSTTFSMSSFTSEIEQKLLRHAQLISSPLDESVAHIQLHSQESLMRDRNLHTSQHQYRPSNAALGRRSRASSPQRSPLRTSGQLQFLPHSLDKPRPVHGSSRTSTAVDSVSTSANALRLIRSGVPVDQVDSIEKLMDAQCVEAGVRGRRHSAHTVYSLVHTAPKR